ncbi:MAG: hypothetical protein GWN47_10550 [Woeseiaceae bacterium]|nr:hypothetical protein [Woeseiaceae bacterium]
MSGKKKRPDYAAIKRHQGYRDELRHGQGLIPFLLARIAMIVAGVTVALGGVSLMAWNPTWLFVIGGIVLILGGLLLAVRGVLGKRGRLVHVWYFLSWFK